MNTNSQIKLLWFWLQLFKRSIMLRKSADMSFFHHQITLSCYSTHQSPQVSMSCDISRQTMWTHHWDKDTAWNEATGWIKKSIGRIIYHDVYHVILSSKHKITERERHCVVTWVDCHVAVQVLLGSPAHNSVIVHILDYTRQAWGEWLNHSLKSDLPQTQNTTAQTSISSLFICEMWSF